MMDILILNKCFEILFKFNSSKRKLSSYQKLNKEEQRKIRNEMELLKKDIDNLKIAYDAVQTQLVNLVAGRMKVYTQVATEKLGCKNSSEGNELVTNLILELFKHGSKAPEMNAFDSVEKFDHYFIARMAKLIKPKSTRGKTESLSENHEIEFFTPDDFSGNTLTPYGGNFVSNIADEDGEKSFADFESRDYAYAKKDFLNYYSGEIIKRIISDDKNFEGQRALQRRMKWLHSKDWNTKLDYRLSFFTSDKPIEDVLNFQIHRYKAWNKINQ